MAEDEPADERTATSVDGVDRVDAVDGADGADGVDATETSGGGPSSSVDALAPTRRRAETVGRFRLETRLGSGGMAHVYRAYDPMLDRAVALKVLRVRATDDRAQSMRRVLREARAAAALTHPNTVTIFEVGEADGEVFLAMELLGGSTLRARMRRGDADFATKMRWLTQAAGALGAAHERGLIHRDIKPENMFVCTPGDTLKILDFGIAKREEDAGARADAGAQADDGAPADDGARADEPQPDSIGPSSLRTEAGVRVGTPRYMAPEQRAGEPTDSRTDQYAWGLVAFELLTGTHAVAAPDTVTRAGPAGASAIADENITTALAANPDVSPKLAAAIARTLEPRKDDRFPSMGELLAEIGDAGGRPRSIATVEAPVKDATPEKPPRARWPIAAGILGIAGIAGAGAALKMRANPGAEIAAAPATPVCRVGMIREFPLGEDDRFAALSDGDVAIARDIKKGLTITRSAEVDGGAPKPLTTHPQGLGILGYFKDKPEYDDVALSGIRLVDSAWVLTRFDQGLERGFFAVGVSSTSFFAQRFQPPISGLVAQTLGKDHIVFGVTTFESSNRYSELPSGAEVYVYGGDAPTRPITIEQGEAHVPSLAINADETRIAFAYALQEKTPAPHQKLQLAILDETGDRISDLQTIRTAPLVYPAVAFAGKATAVVLWLEDLGGSTRIRSATYTPGDAAPTPARTAIEEPALVSTPITTRLPGGKWAAIWVGSQKNTPALRIAPIAADGTLSGATSIAAVPGKFDQVSATPTDRGIYLSWREWREAAAGGARIAKIADIACP